MADASKLATALGFVLTKTMLEDKTYGTGTGGLQEVYDAWLAGDETQALNLYFKSKWYLKLGKTAASRYALSLNQPEVYKAEEDAYISEQKSRLKLVGVDINDPELVGYLKQAYAGNFTNSQINTLITKSASFGTKFGGSILGQTESLKQYANSYGLSYTDDKYSTYGKSLFAGTITLEEIQKDIQTESASAYPAFSDQIMKGVSVDALASAYKSSMANLLEIDADSIGYNDSTLRQALQYVGVDGKPATKPLWQFEKELRSDSRWQYTNNARDTIDSLSLKVLRDWGLA
jgi:hypothetical protein